MFEVYQRWENLQRMTLEVCFCMSGLLLLTHARCRILALHEHFPLGKVSLWHQALVHSRRIQIEKADMIIIASDLGGHLKYWIMILRVSTPTT